MTGEPVRCWPTTDPEYRRYHDEEWGRPVTGETELLERLCLEGFQSGLSWLTVLRKRENFRAAFAGFEPEAVAAFGGQDVERLLQDAGIIRHRGKIEATIANARATLALHDEGRTLLGLLREHAPPPHGPYEAIGEGPTTTAEATACAKAMKQRGFRFLGPTTVYSAMQAVGIVNDHIAGCHVRAEVEAARRSSDRADHVRGVVP